MIVAGILLGSLLLVSLSLGSRFEGALAKAVLFGAALAAANTLAAHALLLWSRGRPLKSFLIAVLGGMAGRMAVVLGLLLVAMMGLELPTVPLVASLMGYFAVFQALELLGLRGATPAAAEAR